MEDEYGEEEEEELDEGGEPKKKELPKMPVFDEEEFMEKWLNENPEVEIPIEMALEKDNDWVLGEEEEEALIQGYFSAKEEK